MCTVKSDTSGCNIATINPYRYRSYYYDVDTGLYYLQSRYYDPIVGRFVNADEAEVETLCGSDSFAYCTNNCVNYKDPYGYYKVSIRVRTPNVGSTVAWSYSSRNGFDVGHAFLVLNPGIIYRGFGMNSKNPVFNTIFRRQVKGIVYDEPRPQVFNEVVSYNITKTQYDIIKKFLYPKKMPKYHIVSYNCVTFAIEALDKAGIKHNFKKHIWSIGEFKKIPVPFLWYGSIGVKKHTFNGRVVGPIILGAKPTYGYYPARLAYDIRNGIR